MSAAPTPDPSLWVDTALTSGLGVLSGIVSWLLSPDPKSLGCMLRHLIVAGITAAFVGLAVRDFIDSEGLRLAVGGSAGYAGAIIWDRVLGFIKAALDWVQGKLDSLKG